MLASVTSPAEAEIVLSAGVEIVDLKNPAEGALGAMSHDLVEDVVQLVGERAVVSATIGDLPMEAALILSKTEEMLETGVDVVKIGFFGEGGHEPCIQALSELASGGAKLIAVLLVDISFDLSLLNKLAAAGFYGVMLDTAQKDRQHLLNYCTMAQLTDFVCKAQSLGLRSGLAGSLSKEHVNALLSIRPSYLGFRGALCDQSKRTATLDSDRVQELAGMLHRDEVEEVALRFVNQTSCALI
jgi:uncharacterized protein (UPF0264 family)